MNNISFGDKLALTGKVRELKMGTSFDSGPNVIPPGFHTFRYDFKPASVDTSQVARVDVEQRHQISVTVPHHDSTSSTTFRGSQRPYQKECVLIIDHKTGEVTLERLSCNVQLKKTRAEGSSKVLLGPQTSSGTHGRPLTPGTANQGTQGNSQDAEIVQPAVSRMKRPSPPMPHQRTHTPTAMKQRISPVGAPRQPITKQTSQSLRPQPSALAANSMPMLLDDSGRFDETGLNLQQATQPPAGLISTPVQNAHLPKVVAPSMPTFDSNTDVIEMSEGSSSSSSSSESSSDGSDSESDDDGGLTLTKKPAPAPPPPPPPTAITTTTTTIPLLTQTSHMPTISTYAAPQANRQSMPKLSQLSEDLQLSESGSDSE